MEPSQRRANLRRVTWNDLPEETRTELVELLNVRLAQTIDLRLHAKQAHWNLRGPRFIALHELFDQVASAGSSFQDLLGERIAQLGGYAAGTLEAVTQATELMSYPIDISREDEHVQYVADALSRVASSTRSAIRTAEHQGDPATADILIEITKEADKLLWFVESHIEENAHAREVGAVRHDEAHDGEQPSRH